MWSDRAWLMWLEGGGHLPVSAANGGSAAKSESHRDASDLRGYRYGWTVAADPWHRRHGVIESCHVHHSRTTARRTPRAGAARPVQDERSTDDPYRLRLRAAVDGRARQPAASLFIGRPAPSMPLDRYPVATRWSPASAFRCPRRSEGVGLGSPRPLRPLLKDRPGLVTESRTSGSDQHQFPSASAAFPRGGAPSDSSTSFRCQIHDAYGPLFRFLAPWW